MKREAQNQQEGHIPLYFLIMLIVLALDQIAKKLALIGLNAGETIPVIKNTFHITLVLNKGVAFGLFAGKQDFIIVTSFFVTVAILIYFLFYSAKERLLTKLGLSFILGGAVGNLIDRLQLGVAIDFLDIRVWPVFNVADSAICVGAALLLMGIFIGQTLRSAGKA